MNGSVLVNEVFLVKVLERREDKISQFTGRLAEWFNTLARTEHALTTVWSHVRFLLGTIFRKSSSEQAATIWVALPSSVSRPSVLSKKFV